MVACACVQAVMYFFQNMPPALFSGVAENLPSGPVTVILFLIVGFHIVTSWIILGCPIDTSTPGGTESGVRPSFDDRFGVEEKGRRTRPCHAGSRNDGSVAADDPSAACLKCLAPVWGAIIEAMGPVAGKAPTEREGPKRGGNRVGSVVAALRDPSKSRCNTTLATFDPHGCMSVRA